MIQGYELDWMKWCHGNRILLVWSVEFQQTCTVGTPNCVEWSDIMLWSGLNEMIFQKQIFVCLCFEKYNIVSQSTSTQ